MNYGVILASGKGTRMKDGIGIPKQFRLLNGIPVIIYTIKNMLKVKRFDKLYIAVLEDYLYYIKIEEYLTKKELEKIEIVIGGDSRMDSINNTIDKIQKDNTIDEDDVIVIHDAVRPFVTEKILNDSIDTARNYGACVAAIPVSDTLLISNSFDKVDEIPNRSIYYKGQAPDSFKLKKFIELFNNLTEEQKKIATGTSQVCTMNNYPIYIIEGDEINFKITTSSDLTIAQNIVKGENNEQ